MTQDEIISLVLVGLGLLAILIELVIGLYSAFDLVIVGSAFVLGGLVGYFTNSFVIGIVVTSLICFIYFLLLRSYIRSKLNVNTHPSNIDALNGKTGVALKDFDNQMNGKVKIEGETWSAHSNTPLSANDKVKVLKADGVILEVTKLVN